MKKTSVSLFVVFLFLMFSSSVLAGTVVFGPNQYSRTSGAPNVYAEMFSAAPGEALLTVTNGNPSGKHRVTSALIYINDEVVFNTDDFKQKDYILEIPLQLLANNSVAVELTSKPGTYLSIEITQQKTSVSFSCSPEFIFNGQTSTLSWSSVLADTVFIDNGIGDVPLNGSLTVPPTVTTTYTITATGIEGTASQQATIYVTDAQQPVVTLEASNTDIFTGGSVTLSWTSSHADTCEITPNIGSVELNGSLTVTPTETTTYDIAATGFGGTASSSVTVCVTPIPIPIVSLISSPETILTGETATLSWSVENAESVSIEPGIGPVDLTGFYTVTLAETTTYTITATGPGGTASDQATVTVSVVPQPVCTLGASSTDIVAGGSTTLSWTSENADFCEIAPDIGIVELNGSLTVSPSDTTTYTITATGIGGTSSASATITVTSPITLQIISPLDGEAISSRYVMVSGLIANSTGNETGVVVDGMAALMHDGQFFINHLSLEEGVNTISIIATDSAGAQVSQEVTVIADFPSDYVRLDASREAGLAPLEIELYVSGSFSLITPAEINSSGPGPVSILESGIDQFKVSLPSAGVYYLTATATNSGDDSFANTIAIVALDQSIMDTMLSAKWSAMTDSLSNGDTVAASGFFANDVRETYASYFDLLKDHFPEIVSSLHDLQLVKVTENEAEYIILGDQDGQTYSFYLLFVKDADGIWRISFF